MKIEPTTNSNVIATKLIANELKASKTRTDIINKIEETDKVTISKVTISKVTISKDVLIKEKFDIMKKILQKGKHTVNFTKKDGTSRDMVCTLDPKLIPDDKKPSDDKKSTRKVSEEAMPVYDLEKEGWRSFCIESVNHLVLPGDK